jgi:hypothetical protein
VTFFCSPTPCTTVAGEEGVAVSDADSKTTRKLRTNIAKNLRILIANSVVEAS